MLKPRQRRPVFACLNLDRLRNAKLKALLVGGTDSPLLVRRGVNGHREVSGGATTISARRRLTEVVWFQPRWYLVVV